MNWNNPNMSVWCYIKNDHKIMNTLIFFGLLGVARKSNKINALI